MTKRALLLALCAVVGLCCWLTGDAAEERMAFPAMELQREHFIGRWQDYPVLGNGWSGTLNFYEDGTFIFLGDMRAVSRYVGTWAIEHNQLAVNLTSADLSLGAQTIQGIGGDYLWGGRMVTLPLEPPIQLRYGAEQLHLQYDYGDVEDAGYYTHGDSDGMPVMRFLGIPYWKFELGPFARWTLPTRELIQGVWTDEWDAWGGASAGETDESYFYQVGEIVPEDASLTFLAFGEDGTCSLGWRLDTEDQLYQGAWTPDASDSCTIHIQLRKHETLTGASLMRTEDGFAFQGGVREEQPLGELRAFDYIIDRFGHFEAFDVDNPQAPLRAYFGIGQRGLDAGYMQKILGAS